MAWRGACGAVRKGDLKQLRAHHRASAAAARATERERASLELSLSGTAEAARGGEAEVARLEHELSLADHSDHVALVGEVIR